MLSRETYDLMKTKYGLVGSWAVWSPAGTTPKSNTGDMSWMEENNLLEKLDTGFVFVGLNWSSTHGDQSEGGRIAWKNFHSDYPYQQDYKLRYALTGTKYWGSYMTDLIKMFPEVDSSSVMKYLKENPAVVKENISSFKEEISLLEKNPVLVALGGSSFQLLDRQLGGQYAIIKAPHYSSRMGKEKYREALLAGLKK